MNFKNLERLYVTGEYIKLIEDINYLLDSKSNLEFSNIDKSIIISYQSRALIRLGKVEKVENLLKNTNQGKKNEELSIQNLINETSLINLYLTTNAIQDMVENGKISLEMLNYGQINHLKQNSTLYEYWASYYLYLIGIYYYYKLEYNISKDYFINSLELNKTNDFIKAKSYYYLTFLETEFDTKKIEKNLERSLILFKKLEAKQGIAWIYLWQGQILIQNGDFKNSKTKLTKGLNLFTEIKEETGLNLVRSLQGLVLFHEGHNIKARDILNDSLKKSINLGNPMIASYCLIPFVIVNLEFGNRDIVKSYLDLFKSKYNKTKDKRVKIHFEISEILYKKQSNNLKEKDSAKKKLLKLLELTKNLENNISNSIYIGGDKSLEFFLIMHLAELYYYDFVTSKEVYILEKIESLINYQYKNNSVIFSPIEDIQLSLLKSKIDFVTGNLDKALINLSKLEELTKRNNYLMINEKINKEINKIESQFNKIDIKESAMERVSISDMESYFKEVLQIRNIAL